MPLTFVGATHVTSFDGTVTRSVTAGAVLFLASVVNPTDGAAVSATDSQGNTWTRDAHVTASSGHHIALFRAVAGSTGSLTVTVAVSGTYDTQRFELAEFSGTLASSPLDKTAVASGGPGTTLNSGATATTADAVEFLFGVGGVSYSGTSFTPDAPWTDRTVTPSERVHIASREVSSTGTYSLTGTLSASETWGGIVATYKYPAAGSSSVSPSPSASVSPSSSVSPSVSPSASQSPSSSPSPSIAPQDAVCWGEQTPGAGIEAVTWQRWQTSPATPITVAGDQNWGDAVVPGSLVPLVSPVTDTGDTLSKTVTAALNTYAAGSGSVVLEIRGSATPFDMHDASPSWAAYAGPTAQAWRYIQLRIYQL